jgi:poly(A) polymerase
MRLVLDTLRSAGVQVRYTRFSALDRFFRRKSSPALSLNVSCGIIDLAKLFSGLSYPAIEDADAALTCENEQTVYFTCADNAPDQTRDQSFEVLELLYDPFRDSFYDPKGIYPLLRADSVRPRFSCPWIAYGAVLVSRYAYNLEKPPASPEDGTAFPEARRAAIFSPESQRRLLTHILSGENAFAGLEFLQDSGLMDALWPELAALRNVSHSKEYHPEGDVWEHTRETFRYRKSTDLTTALALLLHDAGKPYAEAQEGRRFDRHAEIGAAVAEKFLRRLEFPEPLIQNVRFLVKNHMLPGALKSLPAYRTKSVMQSELFPLLLEVYRCDLSSTFRGPDGYYEACKVYKTFLKHRRNPFRGSDGKIIRRA